MTIKEYCEVYKIPFEDVRTYKLVTHTGKGAYYNIASNQIKGDGFEDFYKNLLSDLEKYWEDENWGEDLELFKVNFYEALNFINDYNLSNREYYYINLETARNEIFIDKDCWTYFIGIFSLDKKNSNVITMCFGND